MQPDSHNDRTVKNRFDLKPATPAFFKRLARRQQRHNQNLACIAEAANQQDHVPTLAEIAANQQALDDMLIAAKKPCAYCGENGTKVWTLSMPRVTVKKRHKLWLELDPDPAVRPN